MNLIEWVVMVLLFAGVFVQLRHLSRQVEAIWQVHVRAGERERAMYDDD